MTTQANPQPGPHVEVVASDLVGCRYRLVQSLRYPNVPSTQASLARAGRLEAGRAAVAELLPRRRAVGDGRGRAFLRIDVDPADDTADLATLEAIAAGADIITGAIFHGLDEASGLRWRVRVDALVRTPSPEGLYMPVLVSNHRVAKPDPARRMRAIATNRLGLSAPLEVAYRQRHHVIDGYRLGLAARGLAEAGSDSGVGAMIGQERTLAFLAEDTSTYQPALSEALAAAWPQQPRRLKECASCRFWSLCEPELIAADDISLVLPGDRANTAREKGITTVTGLRHAGMGESSDLAWAWQESVTLLSRVERIEGPRADVEIDVDMEAYLDQGAYLWGAFDGQHYRPFVTWQRLGGRAEAENFARFWRWLMARREEAVAGGQSFAAYCYSAHGENHWLRSTARRFGGMRIGEVTVPTLAEVEQFIASDEWIDIFTWVRSQLYGPEGIGLKVVAQQAGYFWEDEGFDGEASVDARHRALGDASEAIVAQEKILRYNEDDTRATAAVRHWLQRGAPGVVRRSQD